MHVHDEANFHYSLMLLTYHDLILQHITECNAAASAVVQNLLRQDSYVICKSVK